MKEMMHSPEARRVLEMTTKACNTLPTANIRTFSTAVDSTADHPLDQLSVADIPVMRK